MKVKALEGLIKVKELEKLIKSNPENIREMCQEHMRQRLGPATFVFLVGLKDIGVPPNKSLGIAQAVCGLVLEKVAKKGILGLLEDWEIKLESML